MTAISTLRQNAQAQTLANVVDLSIRHLLAKALTDSGKFEAVNTKMDSRRNSLSIKVRGGYRDRTEPTIVAIAARSNLTVKVRVTSSGYNETTFKVEQLVHTNAATIPAPTQTAVARPKTLADAVQATLSGSVPITLAGVSLGYISDDAARRIKAIVTEDQRPKTVTLDMVDPGLGKKVQVTVPTAVADAIKNKVPSFSQGTYSVKATAGIVIVRDTRTNGYWVAV